LDESLRKLGAAPLIHKWFARRRPAAVKKAFDLLIDAIGHGRQLTILDSFAGSGSLLLEIKRRGHKFYGIDINPVAALISDYTLNPPDIEALEAALDQLDTDVGGQIRQAYATESNGDVGQGVTYFHSRVVTCSCGSDVELHHSWLLARKREDSWATYLCRFCKSVFVGGLEEEVRCPDCDQCFRWPDGTIRNTLVTCPSCGRTTRLLDLASVLSPPRHRLVAVEVVENAKRAYRRPTETDFARANGRPDDSCVLSADALRRVPIPAEGRFDPRPISHGFVSYGDLFTDRQLWALGLLAERVRDWPDERLRGALALALSDAAGSNNLLCRYAADWFKLTPAFGIHGYHPVSRPVEGNVWGADIGRGSFRNCVRKAIRAYRSLGCDGDQAGGTIVCGDATKIDLPDSSVDAVFTDPPYYDFVDYGDLSDFYYQWLRICLPAHPWFSSPSARIRGDISSMRGEAEDSFSNGLAAVFKECLRVLKPGGPLVFSYHHSTAQGWWQLLFALRDAGLVVANHSLVRSELNNGFHSFPGNIKSDAIFLCFSREHTASFTSPTGSPSKPVKLSDTDSRMAAYASAVEALSKIARLATIEELREAAQEAQALAAEPHRARLSVS